MADLKLVGGKAAKPAAKAEATVVMTPAETAQVQEVAQPFAVDLDAIAPGTQLGAYLIVSKVGEGGMGAVYRAQDTVLNRTVALKVLSPYFFRNREFLERFRIEAQAQARLNGPNIVTLHSMFDIPGSLVLVLEYVEGQTLAQRLQNEGKLSIASAVWLFDQALLGVERAHRVGIVHRDLKPSNIFITKDHEVKLMDFGVAKIMNNDGPTQVGSIIGTLRYISPEQIKGQDADFRSDIYTLGVTLYEAVTGTVPFKKSTEYEYMQAHLHEPAPLPSSANPEIPRDLEAVILRAIEKDPNKRFQSAREFRGALLTLGIKHIRAYRRVKAHERALAKAVQRENPRARDAARDPRRLRVWAAAVSATVLIGAVLAITLRPSPPATRIGAIEPVPAPAHPAKAIPPLAPASPASTTTAAAAEPKRAHAASRAPGRAAPTARKHETVRRAEPGRPAPARKYDVLRRAWGG